MWKAKYAAFAAVLLAICLWPAPKPPFCGLAAEYEVWLGANSSAGRTVLCEGEYAAVDARSLGGVAFETQLSAAEVLQKLGATVLFSEQAGGVTSYYAAADLPFAIEMDGKTVNLHVAVRGDGSVKVGSPLIFGAY